MPKGCRKLESACTRLPKDEDGRGFALMLRDASQRATAAGEAAALASRCDAPCISANRYRASFP